MGRLAWSQMRFRLARTLALMVGVLVAATAFTVLTAASRTAQVRTLGTVSPPGRALLAVPVAIAVAVVGGLAPAWLAARADPITSVRPPVLAAGRAHQPRGITGVLAVADVVFLNITERAAELATIRSFCPPPTCSPRSNPP